jgi:deoxyribonuclease-4
MTEVQAKLGVRLGVHVSIAGSVDKAVDRARERGCNTFQIFTRNPRGWKPKDLGQEEADAFIRKLRETAIDPPVAHMPYLPNIAAPAGDVYSKSLETLIGELDRCQRLRIPYLVTHLGSHLGKGMEAGQERIVSAVNKALEASSGDVMLLLENTSGAKNSMGTKFQEIKKILDHVVQRDRVGVCLDTCHGFAGGYDLRTTQALDRTLEEFDRVIGLSHLKVVHLNDAKGELGSGLDRHEHIGLGRIGEDGFRAVLTNKVVRQLPLILETPIDARRDDYGNLEKVRELAGSTS